MGDKFKSKHDVALFVFLKEGHKIKRGPIQNVQYYNKFVLSCHL